MGRRKKKLGIHAINLLILTYTQQCIVGATLRLEGGGMEGGRRRRIFLFGAAHSSHGGVRKTPYTPVYTLSFSISGLFHLSSSRVI
jgi:hypothetical protein